MDLSVLASQAVNIVISVTDKVTDGALRKAGADVLDFLKAKFQEKLKIEIAKKEPKLLEAAIISEAISDKVFQSDLERLVTKYQQVQNTSNFTQNTESGVNINVSENSGTVIGQQFFR